MPPQEITLSNCGSVKITKKDDAGNAPAGAEFTLFKDNAPTGGSRGAEDTITTRTCTTGVDGTCEIGDVVPGEYWVVETKTPPNHDAAADQHVTVTANVQTSVSFVDPRQRGAILVTKTRKHAADGAGDHPQAGVAFTVDGVTKTTDASGHACFDGLLFGSYTVRDGLPVGRAWALAQALSLGPLVMTIRTWCSPSRMRTRRAARGWSGCGWSGIPLWRASSAMAEVACQRARGTADLRVAGPGRW